MKPCVFNDTRFSTRGESRIPACFQKRVPCAASHYVCSRRICCFQVLPHRFLIIFINYDFLRGSLLASRKSIANCERSVARTDNEKQRNDKCLTSYILGEPSLIFDAIKILKVSQALKRNRASDTRLACIDEKRIINNKIAREILVRNWLGMPAKLSVEISSLLPNTGRRLLN